MTPKPTETIASFFSTYTLKTYAKGELIIHPSDEALPPITYLESGFVSQHDISQAGNKVVVNIFKPGAFFPASSAINHTHNTYFFEAMTTCTVRQAPARTIEKLLQENPSITYDLLQRVYRGTDGILSRLALLLGGTAHSRLLQEIIVCAERFGEKDSSGIILRITEAELAIQTGLARETVSRELKKLKEAGILTLKRGVIVLVENQHR